MSKSVILKPRISEKAFGLSEQTNTYVFDVSGEVNKHNVASAVIAQYQVGVISVRIASVPGKAKRAYKKRGRNIKTKRNDIRKAYVTLKQGDKLPLFNAVEEETKAAKETK